MNGHSHFHADGTLLGMDANLQKRVLEARELYCSQNPKSQVIAQESAKYFPGGSTRSSLQMTPFTLTFASGQEATLTSVDGHTYDDFLGEYSAGIFGHANPTIRKAIEEALSHGWNYGGHSRYEGQLAKAVCARFQPTMEQVRFTNSGTEANTFALATALAYFAEHEPQRRRIMVFDGGYHGGTLTFPVGAQSLSPVNLPHDFLVAPFDDIDGVKSLFADPALDLARTLAAVLVEPMQGSAGARPASAAFLTALRAACTRAGALLIFDEVQTSRLGPAGRGAALGVRPDLMTIGKWVGGGMTFGAFGGRADLLAAFGPRGRLAHAGTFNNNIVTMAAGLAGLQLMTPDVLAALNACGDHLREELQRILADGMMTNGNGTVHANTEDEHRNDTTAAFHPRGPPAVVSGIGSILAVNFRGPHAAAAHALFWHTMLLKGIYLAPRGFVALSIAVTTAQIDRFIAAFSAFVHWWRGEIGEV